MNTWIDSHAHLYMEEFDTDRDKMIDRSRAAGVAKVYMPNVDVVSIDAMLAVEQAYPDYCKPMLGLHPCYIGNNFERDLYQIEGRLAQRPFAAIGEIGLDAYHDDTYMAQQKEALITQLGWARHHSLPVAIHCRGAMEEIISLIGLHGQGIRGVFHCFTGSADQAQRIAELGFFLGLGGVSTFKNGGLAEVIPTLKKTHVLLETDSPYLSPTPHRGRRNEPAYIPLIAARVADLMGISLKDLSAATNANANHLFVL